MKLQIQMPLIVNFKTPNSRKFQRIAFCFLGSPNYITLKINGITSQILVTLTKQLVIPLASKSAG